MNIFCTFWNSPEVNRKWHEFKKWEHSWSIRKLISPLSMSSWVNSRTFCNVLVLKTLPCFPDDVTIYLMSLGLELSFALKCSSKYIFCIHRKSLITKPKNSAGACVAWKIIISILKSSRVQTYRNDNLEICLLLTGYFDELNNRSLIDLKLSYFVCHFVDSKFRRICIPSIYLKWQCEWICCKLIIDKITNIFLSRALFKHSNSVPPI